MNFKIQVSQVESENKRKRSRHAPEGQRAHSPGHRPGLCARWAFSPLAAKVVRRRREPQRLQITFFKWGGYFFVLLKIPVIYLARKKGLHTFAPFFMRNKERNAIPWLKIFFKKSFTNRRLNYTTYYYLLLHAHARREDPPFQPSTNCTRSHRGNQRKNKTKIHENASKTYSRMGSICV